MIEFTGKLRLLYYPRTPTTEILSWYRLSPTATWRVGILLGAVCEGNKFAFAQMTEAEVRYQSDVRMPGLRCDCLQLVST